MKNLGYYVGSVALGLSLTMGGCEKPEVIPPETSVKLENMIYYESSGKDVCLYYSSGNMGASLDKDSNGMVVAHDLIVTDGDGLKEIYHGRFKEGRHFHYEPDKPKTKTEITMLENSPHKKHFDKPYRVIVTDMKENEKTFSFPIEFVKKHGKIMNHKAPNAKGKCDKNF